jgi:hypothetical protein
MILETLGREADVNLQIDTEEAAWEYLLENARPEERVKLRQKPTREKRQLVDQVMAHFSQRLESPN